MTVPIRVPAGMQPLFQSLLHSPDPVFITDRHNRIVFWNAGAERILGYSAEEATGELCGGMLEGCDVHENRYCGENCPVTQMAARNEPVRQFDLSLRARDGRAIAVSVSILELVVRAPDEFFLAHILKPPSPARAHPRQEDEEDPPRPTLVAARESRDARARKLTGREVEVLGMLTAGHPTAEIAARLHISNLTARNHIQNILDKLEVHSKAEAVAFAFQKRLI